MNEDRSNNKSWCSLKNKWGERWSRGSCKYMFENILVDGYLCIHYQCREKMGVTKLEWASLYIIVINATSIMSLHSKREYT